MRNWSVLEITYLPLDIPFQFRTITNNPCHLWCFWTATPPDVHKGSRVLRGLRIMWGAYFCFVGPTRIEQDEPGDTTIHTFTFPAWPFGDTRWFTWKGTIGGLESPSVGPIMRYTRPYLIICPVTHSDGHLMRWFETYTAQHDAPLAIWISDGDFSRYQLAQWIPFFGTAIHRMAWFFDATALPQYTSIAAARITFLAIRNPGTPFDAVLVSGSGLNDPLQLPDYGWLLPQTFSLGSTPVLRPLQFHHITLNEYGYLHLFPLSIIKFGLRSSLDISATPPTAEEYAYIYTSYSATPPYLTIAYHR